ncbi:MAG: hypothetical protein ACXVII_41775, partial [Solirubrobacteraceae bacterium]
PLRGVGDELAALQRGPKRLNDLRNHPQSEPHRQHSDQRVLRPPREPRDRPAHAETSDQGVRIGRARVAIPKDQRTLATHPFGDGSLLVLALCDTLRWMDTERCQCVKCGYPLQAPTSACPVCQPGGGVPEHVKEQWAISHARDNVLFLAGDGAVVPESALWEQAGLLEEDVRPLLSRMEEDGEIDRFAGFYRLHSAAEASSD